MKADCVFRFSDLPGELRIKIWHTILHDYPYTAWIRLREVKDSNGQVTHYTMVPENKPPLLLRLCRESRAEALRHYSLRFGTNISPPRVYFNPNTDVAYLNTRNIRELDIFDAILTKTDKRSLRSLILKVKDWAASTDEWFAKFMWQFVKLRQVLLIVGSDAGDRVYIENPELPAVITQELNKVRGGKKGRRPPRMYIEECPGLEGFYHRDG
jgi:hypothetical protein